MGGPVVIARAVRRAARQCRVIVLSAGAATFVACTDRPPAAPEQDGAAELSRDEVLRVIARRDPTLAAILSGINAISPATAGALALLSPGDGPTDEQPDSTDGSGGGGEGEHGIVASTRAELEPLEGKATVVSATGITGGAAAVTLQTAVYYRRGTGGWNDNSDLRSGLQSVTWGRTYQMFCWDSTGSHLTARTDHSARWPLYRKETKTGDDVACRTIPSPTRDSTTTSDEGGTDPGGGGGGGGGDSSNGTMCWTYYEWDLSTGDVTELFSTCPKGQYTTSVSGLPVSLASVSLGAGVMTPAEAVVSVPPSASGVVSVAFALVDRLPIDAPAVAARRLDPQMPDLILVRRGASARDVGAAVEVFAEFRRRATARPNVEVLAVPSAAARERVNRSVEQWSATLLRNLDSAPVTTLSGHGAARVVRTQFTP